MQLNVKNVAITNTAILINKKKNTVNNYTQPRGGKYLNTTLIAGSTIILLIGMIIMSARTLCTYNIIVICTCASGSFRGAVWWRELRARAEHVSRRNNNWSS